MLYLSADNTSHIPDEEAFQDTATVSLPVTTADTPVGEAGPEKQAILHYTICRYLNYCHSVKCTITQTVCSNKYALNNIPVSVPEHIITRALLIVRP